MTKDEVSTSLDWPFLALFPCKLEQGLISEQGTSHHICT